MQKPKPMSTSDASAQLAVLIVTDNAEFARTLMGRWQSERIVPACTVVTSDFCSGGTQGEFSLAVVGPVRGSKPERILRWLEAAGAPVIYVADGAQSAAAVRGYSSRTIVLHQHQGWVEALIPLAAEAMRRADALARLHRAERNASVHQRHATLGRYMLEMRHGLNNCLTSILGNAELLLLEPGVLTGESREQVQTIHHMALRLHDVLQRFSSLESELQAAEKPSQN